tara:strand:- start:1097 stop:2293 length:1197 start_codon:yes stop_codon:yes gene_type:complete
MNRVKPELLFIYIGLFLYFIFSTILLIEKSKVGSDYAISEMIINYNGGFTRRGFLGQIFYFLHNNLNFDLNNVIVFFQILFSGFYTIFLFFLFKKIKKKINKLDILILFLPTLLFYPLYELESLGRKEILIFISFSFLVLQGKNIKLIVTLIFSLLVLPFIVLTWEIFVLYLPFYFLIFYIQYNVKNFTESLKIFLIFFPAIIAFIFIWFNPIDKVGHEVMCKTIKCTGYGAPNFLLTTNVYFDGWIHGWMHEKASIINYFRYFVFLIISLLPFYIFSINSKIIKTNLYLFNNFKYFHHIIIILFFFPISLYLYALDWGRWVNIFITLTYITMIFFRSVNLTKHKNLKIFDKINNFYLTILFFIYCLSWNPKILLWDDTGSFPALRLVIKVIKLAFYI